MLTKISALIIIYVVKRKTCCSGWLWRWFSLIVLFQVDGATGGGVFRAGGPRKGLGTSPVPPVRPTHNNGGTITNRWVATSVCYVSHYVTATNVTGFIDYVIDPTFNILFDVFKQVNGPAIHDFILASRRLSSASGSRGQAGAAAARSSAADDVLKRRFSDCSSYRSVTWLPCTLKVRNN